MLDTRSRKPTLIIAWATILIVALYKIVLQEIFHFPVTENLQFTITGLIVVAGFALTFLWKSIHPVRSFFALFIVLTGAQWLILSQLEKHTFLQSWLHHPSFNVYMLAEQGLKLLVTLIVIGFLVFLKKKRANYFLIPGDIAASAEPVSWLGINPGATWQKVGGRFAIFLSLGTLAFLIIAGRPHPDIVIKALPFLPAVLLCAAMNAFHEEMTYKASFLAVLEDIVGRRQALWLMAVYFGIFHFYGIPYGVIGVLMATFLGWFLGKSMLETRGLFWAWFLHFIQDVLIFAFLAIGSITPGG